MLVITDGRDHGSASNQDTLGQLAGAEGVMVYVIGLAGGVSRPGLAVRARQSQDLAVR